MRHARGLALLAALAAAACMSNDRIVDLPGPPDPPRAVKLAFRAYPNVVVAGKAMLPWLEVVVLDSTGAIVQTGDSVFLGFAQDPGPASLLGTTRIAAISGVARFADVRIDHAGSYVLVAKARGLDSAVSRPLEVLPGPSASLRFTIQPQNVTAGAPMEVSIEVLDATGTRATMSAVPVTLSLGANPGGGTLTGPNLTRTAFGGAVRFDRLSISAAGKGYTLLARADDHTDITSAPFDVNPRVAARMSFLTEPGPTVAGDTIAPAIRIAVLDSAGRLKDDAVDSVTVELVGTRAGATLAGTLTVGSDSGVATFGDLRIEGANAGDEFQLRARLGSLTQASTTFGITNPLPIRGNGSLAAGWSTGCALAPGGAAHCWGGNGVGQAGNGRPLESATPIAVAGGYAFTSLVSSIADIGDAGSPAQTAYVCGQTAAGQVLCWGRLHYFGINEDVNQPTDVWPGRRVRDLVVGFRWMCALDEDGRPWCRGRGGDYTPPGFDDNNTTPRLLGGNHVFVEADGSERNFCGLKADGSIWCWTSMGAQTARRVGDGQAYERFGIDDQHGCGLRADGQAFCWGLNHLGELGNGTTVHSDSAVAVTGGHVFASISAGAARSCGVTRTGDAYCWGHGFGTSPVKIEAVSAVATLEAGNDGNVCGTTTSGQAFCVTNARATPVPGDVPFVSVTPGKSTICGIATSGAAWCWGTGVLGDGSTSFLTEPAAVAGSHVFTAMRSGPASSCGLTSAGQLWCWGWGYGSLRLYGDPPYHGPIATPVTVGNPRFAALATGAAGACALTATGEAFCWDDISGPAPAAGSMRFSEISSGSGFACGITRGGRTVCWGTGHVGQLGTPAGFQESPAPVDGDRRFVTVTAGHVHTCALLGDGSAWCWGANGSGQLGAAAGVKSTTPLQVSGSRVFASISAGYDHTCALTPGGEAWCWGDNSLGALGTGSTAGGATPVAVSGGHRFTAIQAAMDYSCGRKTDATIWCWGRNDVGQLGDGTRTDRLAPVQVSNGFVAAVR